jgi:hypothetical protein
MVTPDRATDLLPDSEPQDRRKIKASSREIFRNFWFSENPTISVRAFGVNPRREFVASPEQFPSDMNRRWNFSELVPSVPRSHGHAAETGGIGSWQ